MVGFIQILPCLSLEWPPERCILIWSLGPDCCHSILIEKVCTSGQNLDQGVWAKDIHLAIQLTPETLESWYYDHQFLNTETVTWSVQNSSRQDRSIHWPLKSQHYHYYTRRYHPGFSSEPVIAALLKGGGYEVLVIKRASIGYKYTPSCCFVM
jgi:hypothetical protein